MKILVYRAFNQNGGKTCCLSTFFFPLIHIAKSVWKRWPKRVNQILCKLNTSVDKFTYIYAKEWWSYGRTFVENKSDKNCGKSEKGWHRKGFILTPFNGVVFSRKCSLLTSWGLYVMHTKLLTEHSLANSMFKQCSPNTFPIIKASLAHTHTHTQTHLFPWTSL